MKPSAPEVSEETAPQGPRAFETTHWSLVVRAGGARNPGSKEALEELCRKYWYPLYWFARCRGASQPDAEDLTQGFFEDLLQRDALVHADKNRGRFRSFLLTSFRNFQSHERDRASSLKRGGGREIVSLDALREAESRAPIEPLTTETPEKLFDRKWATHLLQHVLNSLEREYTALGKKELFDELSTILAGGRGGRTHAEIARRMRSTEGAIRVAAHRLRKRFRDELRAEVAQTVESPEEIDDELQLLLNALSA